MYFTNAMANPYDVVFRERAVAAYEAGAGTCLEVAALFGLGHRTLERWVAQWRLRGSVAPRPKGGGLALSDRSGGAPPGRGGAAGCD